MFKQIPDISDFQGGLKVDGGKIFRRVYNASGAAIAAGQAVACDFSNTTYPGKEVEKPATALLDRFAGIAVEAIADGAWGWIQVWGPYDTALVEGTTDITAGDSLKMVNAQWYLVKDAAAGTEATYARHAIAMEGFTTNGTGNIKVFIDAL